VIPLSLFRGRVFTVACLMGLVVGFALFGAVTYLPQYQQIVKGASPTASGLQLLPLMAGVLLASIGSGRLITRHGRYKVFPIAGTAVMTLAMVLLSGLGPDTAQPVAWLYMFVLGVGLGLVMQVLVLAVQNAVPPADLGTATSAATFFRSIGGSIGVSVFGAIFNARFADDLAAGGGAALAGGTGSLTPTVVAGLPAAVHDAVVLSFSDALDSVFRFAIPFAGAAFVLSWFLPEVPLRSRAAPLDGVAEGFGLVRAGAAEVLEEAQVRIRAARAALDRLDEIAARDGLAPAEAEPLRRLFAARIAHLGQQAGLVSADGEALSPQGWQLALDVLQADREAQVAGAGEATADGGAHAVDRQIRQEAEVRLRAARTALRRLEELAPGSAAPPEQVAVVRALMQGRIARIEGTVEKARSGAAARPAAFWRVAAELLAVERTALADGAGAGRVSPGIVERAEHDLAAEQEELVGAAAVR
jgi:MFS family permease